MKSTTYNFSVFSFDSAAGVLRRNDHSLRVPPQTIILLKALLENAGTVLTREDLCRLLWPNDELIDHDRSINRAMNSLRSVLRDDPKRPRFIETLPKRGYRFIAEVSYLFGEGDASSDLVVAVGAGKQAAEVSGIEVSASKWKDSPKALQIVPLQAAPSIDDAPSESMSLRRSNDSFSQSCEPIRKSSKRFFTRLSAKIGRSISRVASFRFSGKKNWPRRETRPGREERTATGRSR